MVGQSVSFSGTLAGSDSDLRVPGIPHVVSFNTSGTLIGPGSTHLRGTLSSRGNPRPGQLLGQFLLRNSGGSMTVNVYRSATPGTYTDKVVHARGADAIYRGATGDLQIAMAWSYNDPITSASWHGSNSFRADDPLIGNPKTCRRRGGRTSRLSHATEWGSRSRVEGDNRFRYETCTASLGQSGCKRVKAILEHASAWPDRRAQSLRSVNARES